MEILPQTPGAVSFRPAAPADGHDCDVISTPGLRRRISSRTRGLLYSMRTNSRFEWSRSLPSFKTANALQRVVCPGSSGRRTYRSHAIKPPSAANATVRVTSLSVLVVRSAIAPKPSATRRRPRVPATRSGGFLLAVTAQGAQYETWCGAPEVAAADRAATMRPCPDPMPDPMVEAIPPWE